MLLGNINHIAGFPMSKSGHPSLLESVVEEFQVLPKPVLHHINHLLGVVLLIGRVV